MIDPRPRSRLPGWMRVRMPEREEMARNKYLKPIAHRFLSPELWRFTRTSVPRGVGLGLFAAFIVPLGQIFLAAFLALPLRANVPIAALATFVTNPLTFPFWAVVANKVGRFVLNVDAAVGAGAGDLARDSGLFATIFETAGVTALGFVVLALVTSVLGRVLAGWIWRFLVGRRRSRRLKEMKRRLDERHAQTSGE
ncbi:DUF2062 domain-containing protein [Qipengyuania sp. MTN3-11]|uniref:DUF2062 domain-containing protein n=1 Tax=Qipengyuania sp. MTN3-11 TaxID=3056557 RepID=UPI0036F3BEDA